MFAHWLSVNWFNIVQTIALLATLVIAASALRASGNATRGANLLNVTAANREIWQQIITNPALKRILRPTMATDDEVTNEERRFALQVFQHSGAAYSILQTGAMDALHGYRRDVHDTMELPVFQVVWKEYKKYQQKDYVDFIESCIAGVNLDDPVGRQPKFGLHIIPVRVANMLSLRRHKTIRGPASSTQESQPLPSEPGKDITAG